MTHDDLLGEGSYGSVYKAFLIDESEVDCESDEYAVKILPCSSDSDADEIKKEIDLLKNLESPFTVSFIESFVAGTELWIVMECCAGGSLQDLNLITSLSEDAMAAVIAFTTLGLDFVHRAKKVIHRDIKPGNILLTLDGKAKLSDFGVSAQLASTMMRRKTVIGSPYWMAPEIIQETSYDGKADVWSMGITLLELCEGKPPHYNVNPLRAIFMISSKPAPVLKKPADWSSNLVDFLSRCLVKNPEKRSSSTELLDHPFIRDNVATIERSMAAIRAGASRTATTTTYNHKDGDEVLTMRETCSGLPVLAQAVEIHLGEILAAKQRAEEAKREKEKDFFSSSSALTSSENAAGGDAVVTLRRSSVGFLSSSKRLYSDPDAAANASSAAAGGVRSNSEQDSDSAARTLPRLLLRKNSSSGTLVSRSVASPSVSSVIRTTAAGEEGGDDDELSSVVRHSVDSLSSVVRSDSKKKLGGGALLPPVKPAVEGIAIEKVSGVSTSSSSGKGKNNTSTAAAKSNIKAALRYFRDDDHRDEKEDGANTVNRLDNLAEASIGRRRFSSSAATGTTVGTAVAATEVPERRPTSTSGTRRGQSSSSSSQWGSEYDELLTDRSLLEHSVRVRRPPVHDSPYGTPPASRSGRPPVQSPPYGGGTGTSAGPSGRPPVQIPPYGGGTGTSAGPSGGKNVKPFFMTALETMKQFDIEELKRSTTTTTSISLEDDYDDENYISKDDNGCSASSSGLLGRSMNRTIKSKKSGTGRAAAALPTITATATTGRGLGDYSPLKQQQQQQQQQQDDGDAKTTSSASSSSVKKNKQYDEAKTEQAVINGTASTTNAAADDDVDAEAVYAASSLNASQAAGLMGLNTSLRRGLKFDGSAFRDDDIINDEVEAEGGGEGEFYDSDYDMISEDIERDLVALERQLRSDIQLLETSYSRRRNMLIAQLESLQRRNERTSSQATTTATATAQKKEKEKTAGTMTGRRRDFDDEKDNDSWK